jgi:3-hydroxy-9,10-secoandrosta-1,3,5(10)-triene-9,17-dione monooxygenase
MSVVDAPPAEGLLERTERLVPALRERAQAAEAARRVPDESFDELAETGVFRMCAPKRFGGYELDFRTQIDVLAAVARGCPSTSWVSTIFSAMAWLAGCFPDEAQEEIFADGDPRIAGVAAPTGSAERVDGGIRVSGRWSFNTGCDGATWTWLQLILQEGEGVPVSIFVPTSELTYVDDWYASGMAATGSKTLVADGVFVPDHRVVPSQVLLDASGTERHNADNPYFNIPLAPVLVVNAGGTPLGIAQGALEAFHERLPTRTITFTNYERQADAPLTHLQVGEATLKLDSLRAHMYMSAAILDGHSGGPMSTELRVKARAHVSHGTQLMREVVDTLFFASGASSIQSHVPIQRFQRDAQALSNHGIMLPTTTTELYGRILCGLEPNTALY